MKNYSRFKVAALFALLFMAFGVDSRAEAVKRISIVCTLFPQYDFAKHIAGDKAEVIMLLPPGTESHTFDPKPSDIRTLSKADVFFYTGDSMEPWAEKILKSLDNPKQVVVNASIGVTLLENHEEDGHDKGHDHEYDPHIWLNFDHAARMVESLAEGLGKADPKNAAFYTANAAAYTSELERLDQDFKEAFKTAKRNVLVFGGRFAYRYFLDRYAVNYVTAYDSCSSESEPSIKRVLDVIRYMKQNGIRVIYHEEFVDPKVARSIAEQTGAEPLLFSTGHNVSKKEFESGIGFIDIMRENLKNIKRGLEIE